MKIKVKAAKIECASFDLAGLVSISFGKDIFIRSVTIVKGKEGALFVSFPSMKVGDSYKEICNPINKEFRQKLTEAIMESYHKGEAVEFDDGKDAELTVSAYPCAGYGKKVGEAKMYINNNFVVSNISIYEMNNGKIYPAMPSYKTLEFKPSGQPIYEEFCSVRKGIANILRQVIVDEYTKSRKEYEAERFSIKGKLSEGKEKASGQEKRTKKQNELEK